MNDLRLILPQENPPQTCDLVRDVLEVLAVLEDPKGQNCKGTKCLGVGGEAGCCGGLLHPCQLLLTPSPWCEFILHLHSPPLQW